MEGIQATTASARSIQLASILRAQYSSGKVSLPVDGGSYARFRHVQGVPGGADGGYSLTKLQMIDLMVERLVRLQGEGFEPPQSDSEAMSSPFSDSGALLEELAGRLHEAVGEEQSLRSRFSSGIVEPGMLLSMYL